jgi:hypothetical protein
MSGEKTFSAVSREDHHRHDGQGAQSEVVRDEPTKIIAVVRDAANAEILEIFRELADQWPASSRTAMGCRIGIVRPVICGTSRPKHGIRSSTIWALV